MLKMAAAHPPNPGAPRRAVPRARPQGVSATEADSFHLLAPSCQDSSITRGYMLQGDEHD